jgi:hypothetical protein
MKGRKKKFIKGAIKHPGSLHRALGVPENDTIPQSKIEAAAQGGGNLARKARFAQTLGRLRK